MGGFVYILKSAKNGSYYIGSTENLDRRVIEHRSGRVKSTKNILPIDIVFSEKFADIRMARQKEYKIKRLKSRKVVEKIISDKEIKLGL